jgi:glutamate N-acetyltransferase/amino-acid N-acetyltransferase
LVDAELLHVALRQVCDKSFNRITVDSDTSTNDSVVLIATGASGVVVDEGNFDQFVTHLQSVFVDLAQAIIRDGEGASKFVSVSVNGALDQDEALRTAFTVAESPLVKTALFASDPNWGRILAAVGRADIDQLEIDQIQIWLNSVLIVDSGARAPSYTEEAGQQAMAADDIEIKISLNRGAAEDTVWTTDFSYDYVRINAEYRT